MPLEQLPARESDHQEEPEYIMTPEEFDELLSFPTDEEQMDVLTAERGVTPEQYHEINTEIIVAHKGKVLQKTPEPAPSHFFRGMPKSAREAEIRNFWVGLEIEIKDPDNPIGSTELLRRMDDTKDYDKKRILKALARKLEFLGR